MTRELRIASVCRELPSPVDPSIGVFVLRRIEAMARLAKVETIQPVAHFPLLRPLPEWAPGLRREGNGVEVYAEPMFYVPKVLKALDGGWLYLSVVRALRRVQQRGGLDIVDAHFGYPEGVGSVLAARRLGVPAFITMRGFEIEYIRKPLIGHQIIRAIRNADGCICVSFTLRDLALQHGVAADRIAVIHNAINRQVFHPGEREASRARLGLPLDEPLVVSVGHLIPRKRHHVLIAAFAEVLRTHPDAKLAVVGGPMFEPHYPVALSAQVKQLGIGQAVRFVGNVDERTVADWLRAADAFALATQREGCCNAVLEALACGLPVVTTPVGDNAYFVEDGANGFIVPVDDPRAMASALVAALEPNRWNRELISHSLEVGDWDGVAKRVLDFFHLRTTGA